MTGAVKNRELVEALVSNTFYDAAAKRRPQVEIPGTAQQIIVAALVDEVSLIEMEGRGRWRRDRVAEVYISILANQFLPVKPRPGQGKEPAPVAVRLRKTIAAISTESGINPGIIRTITFNSIRDSLSLLKSGFRSLEEYRKYANNFAGSSSLDRKDIGLQRTTRRGSNENPPSSHSAWSIRQKIDF